jgi:hypothetical protein
MAKDIFHNIVKNALIKEDWLVTDDPLRLKVGVITFQVDLGAEKVIGAEKAGQKIAVEIKSFLNPSTITDFYNALGQFLSYRLALEKNESDRILYLAVPVDVYESFFQFDFTQSAIQAYQIFLIVYDPSQETITQWIN